MTKKMLFIVAAVSALSGSSITVTSVHAQTNNQNSVPSLVQEIANKFHLNTSDVQSVFKQHQQEMQTRRETNYEKYLANLVKNGKITSAQEQLLLTKHKELLSQKDNTKAQRQAMVKDLQNWAKQNNVPLQYLRPLHRHQRNSS